MLRLPFFGRHAASGSKRGFLSRSSGNAPIAIDFGRRSVRLLQVSKGESAYPCSAAAELPGWVLSADEERGSSTAGDVTARLHDVISQCGFAGNMCMLTLPAEVFQCDTARLPVMPDSELLQSVQFEAADKFGIDKATTVLGHLRLGEVSGGQQDVLIMATPRKAVESAVSPVAAAGLGALHLEHAAFSALRAISRQRNAEVADPAEAANFAMVHIEDRVATLVVVRERVPTMVRCVMGDWAPMVTSIQTPGPRGDAPLTVAGQVAADAIPLEAEAENQSEHTQSSWRWCNLADEALRCLRHLERSLNGWWPKCIVVTGPAACDPQVVVSMESVCGARSELAVPIRLLQNPAPCVHGNPWIATIGSAVAHLPPLSLEGAVSVAAKAEEPADEASVDPKTQIRQGVAV
jgi:hypothetical protein